ncbi:polygalacturonase-like [Diospyros lotus]|uniref:polygalacturonase-like n=1 Tax=Diospyros lotus TaxID=55363 RepID=UPI002253553C|nr:polygalacturonase-like [Diospyros lotus]
MEMVMRLTFIAAIWISFSFIFTHQLTQAQPGIFDITKFGAKQGDEDISQALLTAWKEACAVTTPSTIMIPAGTYLLNEVLLTGPCQGPINIQVHGTLKAPADPLAFKSATWITINKVSHLTISGTGTLDGQGADAWAANDCIKNSKCRRSAMNLAFNFLNDTVVQDITSLDSKLFHVNVISCNNFTFQNFTIIAPESSPNTDGIHMGRSNRVSILDSTIMTGDDCVSVGDGTTQLTVERVTCGPGHGISIGSLGGSPNEAPVEGVVVRNCTFKNTTNGVRIKTKPESPNPSVVTDVKFENIVMNNVANPILIDQLYCPGKQCTEKAPSLVKISKVSYDNIRGTSSTREAVTIACSGGAPCEDVTIGDIDLTNVGTGGPATSPCVNVKPTFTGKQNPPVCSSDFSAPTA